jgi:hypothetical protein
MSIRRLFFISILALFGFSSCGGGVSGENGSDPFGSGTTLETFTITLVILDQQCGAVSEPVFTAGETLCIQATLKQGTDLVSGEIVNFSAGLGSLSVESKLTDNNGVAQVFIESASGDVGAAILSASFVDVSSQNNYEFLADEIVISPVLTIDLMILKNGVAVNRFKANEQVQIQAVIRDDNAQPLENLIVNFTTGRGSLNTNDALTDNSGTAQVTLTPADTDVGAAVVSALTFTNNLSETEGIATTATINAEVVSPSGVVSVIIFVVTLNV